MTKSVTRKILLLEDVDNLGGRGEIVKVTAGYARNYLLPHGIATLATKGNVKQIEQEREALLKKAALEKSTADAQSEQMQGITLDFTRKAGEGGKLFGSVTSMDIAEALQARGYEIDRRRIVLKEAIKETGEFTVSVKLHREVTIIIPVKIFAESPLVKNKASLEINNLGSSEITRIKKEEKQLIKKQFSLLAKQWYMETLHSSSYLDKVLHPAYQRIIGLGKNAIPLILRELKDAPTEWFWALRALTGEDPTTPEQAGKRDEMAKAWLNWGKENDYI